MDKFIDRLTSSDAWIEGAADLVLCYALLGGILLICLVIVGINKMVTRKSG